MPEELHERRHAMPGSRSKRAAVQQAGELMLGFALRTGLAAAGAGAAGAHRAAADSTRRYLWTDAFAVCNFLALERATGERRDRALALELVDQVHRVLGRQRPDSGRTGWLSGLPEAEGAAHPTRGGLRIGKPLPERGPADPRDERLEWDRDGQYFHYLTRWMHALDQLARATGEPRFNRWACELAEAAHRGFLYRPRAGAPSRMHWKMSIDLSRPLVPSMGQHDPLDGLVTGLQLEESAVAMGAEPPPAELVADFRAMIDPAALATADSLGVGGLLCDAWRAEQLRRRARGRSGPRDRAALLGDLVRDLLDAALLSLPHALSDLDIAAGPDRRLAFRELGLAIGLSAAEALAGPVEDAGPIEMRRAGSASGAFAPDRPELQALLRYVPAREAIVASWLEPGKRRTDAWLAHEDINDVMLATTLLPAGYLVLRLE
jgi:hypothetical protein